MIQPTTKFPVDVTLLQKGSIIPADAIIRLTHAAPDTKQYRFGLMVLKEFIETWMNKRGYGVTVKCEGDTLKVLTDSEASAYTYAMHKSAIRALWLNHERAQGVDNTLLTRDEQETHERRLQRQGRVLLALSTCKAGIRAPAYVRSTPGVMRGTVCKRIKKKKRTRSIAAFVKKSK